MSNLLANGQTSVFAKLKLLASSFVDFKDLTNNETAEFDFNDIRLISVARFLQSIIHGKKFLNWDCLFNDRNNNSSSGLPTVFSSVNEQFLLSGLLVLPTICRILDIDVTILEVYGKHYQRSFQFSSLNAKSKVFLLRCVNTRTRGIVSVLSDIVSISVAAVSLTASLPGCLPSTQRHNRSL